MGRGVIGIVIPGVLAAASPATAQAPEPLVVTLVEFNGVSQVDAARQLGVSVSGMKSRVQRARQRLRAA